MTPHQLIHARRFLEQHGLSLRFEPAPDPQLEDDTLQLVDDRGRPTAVHIQLSNELSPGAPYFIVAEIAHDAVIHQPTSRTLEDALALAVRRVTAAQTSP